MCICLISFVWHLLPPLPPLGHIWDVMLVWREGVVIKLYQCYSIVYYYNGAQRYEQFLQVGWLYRALILLGLALCLPSASVSLVFMVLYSRVVFVLVLVLKDKFKVLVLVLGAQSLSWSLRKVLGCVLVLSILSWHLQSRFLQNLLPNTHYTWDFTYLTSAVILNSSLFDVIVCGKFPFHRVFDSLPFRYTFLKFSALI